MDRPTGPQPLCCGPTHPNFPPPPCRLPPPIGRCRHLPPVAAPSPPPARRRRRRRSRRPPEIHRSRRLSSPLCWPPDSLPLTGDRPWPPPASCRPKLQVEPPQAPPLRCPCRPPSLSAGPPSSPRSRRPATIRAAPSSERPSFSLSEKPMPTPLRATARQPNDRCSPPPAHHGRHLQAPPSSSPSPLASAVIRAAGHLQPISFFLNAGHSTPPWPLIPSPPAAAHPSTMNAARTAPRSASPRARAAAAAHPPSEPSLAPTIGLQRDAGSVDHARRSSRAMGSNVDQG